MWEKRWKGHMALVVMGTNCCSLLNTLLSCFLRKLPLFDIIPYVYVGRQYERLRHVDAFITPLPIEPLKILAVFSATCKQFLDYLDHPTSWSILVVDRTPFSCQPI